MDSTNHYSHPSFFQSAWPSDDWSSQVYSYPSFAQDDGDWLEEALYEAFDQPASSSDDAADKTSSGEGDNAEPSPLAVGPQSAASQEGSAELSSTWAPHPTFLPFAAPSAGTSTVSAQGIVYTAGGLALPSQTSRVSGELIAPVPIVAVAEVAAARPRRGRPPKAVKKLPDFFYCRYCLAAGEEKPWENPEGLQTHMVFHHGLLVPGRQEIKCQEPGCGAAFQREADLNKHMRRQDGHWDAWTKKQASAAFKVNPPVSQQEIIDTFALVELGPVSAQYIVPAAKCPCKLPKGQRAAVKTGSPVSSGTITPRRAQGDADTTRAVRQSRVGANKVDRRVMKASIRAAVRAAPVQTLVQPQGDEHEVLETVASSWGNGTGDMSMVDAPRIGAPVGGTVDPGLLQMQQSTQQLGEVVSWEQLLDSTYEQQPSRAASWDDLLGSTYEDLGGFEPFNFTAEELQDLAADFMRMDVGFDF